MNDQKILPDDPQITAYALGELEGESRDRVAGQVRADPALQAAVAEISLFAAALGRALAQEAAEPLPAAAAPRRFPNLLRLPALVTLAGGLAAAVLFVTFTGRKPSPRPALGGSPAVAIQEHAPLAVRAQQDAVGPRTVPDRPMAPAIVAEGAIAGANRLSAAAKAAKDAPLTGFAFDQAPAPATARRMPVPMGAKPASLAARTGFGEPVALSAFKVEGNLVLDNVALSPFTVEGNLVAAKPALPQRVTLRRSFVYGSNPFGPFSSYPFGVPWYRPWQLPDSWQVPGAPFSLNPARMPLFVQTPLGQSPIPALPPKLFASALAPDNAISAANNAFALDLYRQLGSGTGNLFYSPYSISAVLMMAYAGAGGTTEAEMARVLHLTLPQAKVAEASSALAGKLDETGRQGLTLAVANSVWLQQGLRLSESFRAIAQGDYGAGVLFADFARDPEAARLQINRWVGRSTNNRIKDLIPVGGLAPSTHVVLADAIYFKGRWDSPFKAGTTQPAPFFVRAGQTVSAPTMHQQGRFRLARTDGLSLLEMPYAGGSASMVILLPDRGGLPDLESRLTPENLDRWLAGLAQAPKGEVAISLPRFRTTLGYDLAGALERLGMASAFRAGAADFSGMDGARDLYFSDVIHKAFVAVDEEGTEAAAATAATMFGAAFVRATPFAADHPFVFLIRDNQTGTILFLGRIMDPTDSRAPLIGQAG